MITLKNSEVSVFLSPTINNLLDDADRKFPIEDAFRFAELLSQIKPKAQLYQDAVRKIVKANNGTIDEKTSMIQIADSEDKYRATTEILKLNELTVEIAGSKLEIKDSWPKLTLTEALILKPIIK